MYYIVKVLRYVQPNQSMASVENNIVPHFHTVLVCAHRLPPCGVPHPASQSCLMCASCKPSECSLNCGSIH